MQAVKGYLSNGLFTPRDAVVLPSHAEVVLIFGETAEEDTAEPLSEAERQACKEWLDEMDVLLELSRDEDISDFPKQGLMKSLEDYAWFD